MTEQALEEAIKRLIIKRRNAHGNAEEQARINLKLTRLYDIKYLMIKQKNEFAGGTRA